MKKIFVILCAFLLLVPPVQAHVDAIIFDIASETHIETLDDSHHIEHHQNDSDDEKNTEHHHHCSQLGISSAIISPILTYDFVKIVQIKNPIPFYQTLHTSTHLDSLFQPPQV
ncbi:MAG: hypothetical protein COA67_03515 [Lutibacter sp.]|nr:MAG: hypothetical protein COA67_03515 [Lutibacter sp.]